TLAANTPTAGTGTWSIVSGAGGTIATPSSHTSTFTGTAGTTYTLRWTITNPPCASTTDDVVVTFNRNPTTANAGSDQTLCATTATLAGNAATVGTGTWTLVSGSGTITTPNSPTSGITALGVGTNIFRWTISNTPCTATFDEVAITRVAATTTANAGPDQTGAATCGLTTVTLAANTPTAGTGTWSIVSGAGGTITTPSSPNSAFTGTAGTTYTLRWTITNPPCASTTDDVVIAFNQNPTTANAGTAQSVCIGGNITLAANAPTVGTGLWSIVSGPSTSTAQFSSTTNRTATFTPTGVGSYVLRWTISNSPCTASASNVTITVNAFPTTPTISAGGATTFCQGGSVTLTSSSSAGSTYQWNVNGAPIPGATNQTYSATTGGSYTVTVTNASGCSRTSAATPVTVNPLPTIAVSPAAPSAFCSGGSVTLTASGANTYTWSPTEGLSINTGSSVIATPEATTTYTVTGTGANGCTNAATVTVNVTPSPDGDITSSPPVCSGNNSGTITLSNYTGTIVRWESSTNGGASWTTINNTSTTQSYSNLTQTTIYRVLLTLNNGCDGYSDVGIIPVNEPFTPTVTVTPPIICLGESATLKASDYGAPPFPLEDFGNANPAGWSGNDANNNNEDENTDWGETGDGKVRNGKEYNSQAPPSNTKFMIVAGTTDGADQTAALITPPFSLVGVVNPIFGYMTALDFNAGTVGKVEISIDGGATYITLETFTGPAKVGDGNNGFVQRNYNLSAYIGQPDVRVRFNYFGTTGSIWAVDNVGLQGTFEPVTYQWSPLDHMTPAAGNTQTVTVTPPVGTHPYCVVATTGAGCASESVCKDVTVKPLPTCSITGNNTVCPGSTNVYSAPAIAGYTYNWTISGGATISGSATGQTVTVVANGTCGTYTLTLVTTLDGCSSAPCTQIVNIVDNTAPVATAPATQSFQCLTDVPAPGTLTATDNCSGDITATGVDVQVANGCGYTITRTWTFTDACNNTTSVSQTINVLDNTAPVAPAAPASQNFQCLADVTAPGTLSATDNCSGNITATGVDAQVANGCGYTITRTWTFTDACNNTSSVSQIINVLDNIPPVVTCPPAQIFCAINSNTYAIPPATAADNCSGTLNITYQVTGATTRSGTGNDASGVFNVGISTITWTVTDTCGNTSTCTTTVTINPRPAPIISHN
ncbi:HYR-like domain-containing protein, partial [Longitalea luteola]|uniref:HYR-like domain-containing protein n=1 Tax=Longitalea luteola TaxID=2812563 RepID=UPI001A975345